MKELLLTLLQLAVLTAKVCGLGGVRAAIAANLPFKQQLLVLRGARHLAKPRAERPADLRIGVALS